MPKYTTIKSSIQVYFTPWVVVTENPEYVTKEKETRMFAWREDEDGPNIVAVINRKLHRSGHTQSVLFTDSKEEIENNEPIRSVRNWVMDKIQSKNPKILYKKHRVDIMWEGYQWKQA